LEPPLMCGVLLLTRARQGMVLVVPEGDGEDIVRPNARQLRERVRQA